MVNTRVTLSGLELDNPVIPASGTFGFGYEYAELYDINILGSIALKGTTRQPRFGNPTPRIAEATQGIINSIGLQNPGVEAVIREELPKLKTCFHKKAIANVSGFCTEDYVETAEMFDKEEQIGLLEINISCPNVKHGGMAFGTDPQAAATVCRAVKEVTTKPVYMKLSPNVTDIVAIAKAVVEAGADGLVLINTPFGMRIDPRTGRPIVSTKMAGFSGPAIKPVALRMVYQVCQAVDVPVIGVGGIQNADDVLEFLSAGASAVQVGAQNLVDPWACPRIIEELPRKMDEYGIETLEEIIGRAQK